MADTGVIDAARQEEFVGKVVEQISGTMTTLLAAIGDRLGLFKNLAEQGPADIGGTRVANNSKRALSARMAGRNGDGWLCGLRQTYKALQSASLTRASTGAGERPIFCWRHISDAASASRSI